MHEIALCYCPCPDRATALNLAEAAIAAQLAGCGNVLAPCTSVYQWNGAAQQETEVPLLLKTTTTHAAALVAFIADLHPYDTPAVLSWPIGNCPGPFAAWLAAQTATNIS